MKVWKAAELVELGIAKTENGNWSADFEFAVNGLGYNDSLFNDEKGEDKSDSVTPDTLS